MHLLVTLAARAAKFFGYLGALAVVAMMLHIGLDVILRNAFRISLDTVPEIVARYYMTALAFLPLAWAERRGDMISVEVFGHLFRGPLRRLDAAFVAAVTALAYSILAYTTWLVAMREFAVRSYVISLSMTIPVWPSYFILPLSFGLAMIVCLLRLALVLAGREPAEDAAHALEQEFRE